MLTLIGRYLSVNFIMPFIMSSGFFATFLLTFQLLKITALVVNKGVELSMVLTLLFYVSITFLPIIIPISILFAIIYALNHLSSDSELVVMRSLGLSLERLLIPFLLVALMIGLTLYALSFRFIPKAETRVKEMIITLTSKGMLTDIKAGQFFTDLPGYTIWAKTVEQKGREMDEVFIHNRGDDESEKVIYAQRGELVQKSAEEGGGMSLKLLHGNIIKKSNPGNLEKILFEEYLFPLTESAPKLSLATKDSMKSTPELYQIVTQNPKNLPFNHEDFIRSKLEFWSRINNSLMCLLFAFCGFSLGVQKTRGKVQNSVGMCLLILVIYYAVLFGGISVARSGKVDAVVAIFIPSLFIFLVATTFFKRLRWVA